MSTRRPGSSRRAGGHDTSGARSDSRRSTRRYWTVISQPESLAVQRRIDDEVPELGAAVARGPTVDGDATAHGDRPVEDRPAPVGRGVGPTDDRRDPRRDVGLELRSRLTALVVVGRVERGRATDDAEDVSAVVSPKNSPWGRWRPPATEVALRPTEDAAQCVMARELRGVTASSHTGRRLPDDGSGWWVDDSSSPC